MTEFVHLFSLEEAQQLLQELLPRLDEMVTLKQELNRKGYDVFRHQYLGGRGPNGDGSFPAELERLVDIYRHFNERGIEIKDLDTGLIDFPHRRSTGEYAYLCYRAGESEIGYWHPIDSGFATRRPVSEL